MDQMNGCVAASGTELHFSSDASKREVGHWYGLALLKMSELHLFRMNSKLSSKSFCLFSEVF